MKIKTILASLCSVLLFNGAIAGTAWTPPDKGPKCPIDDCPDIGGSIAMGYETDYIFRGVRLTEDAIWVDANYTFDQMPLVNLPLTIGVKHVTGLASRVTYFTPFGGASDGDQSNIYASVGLPSVLGFDLDLGYDHYLYSNLRGPSPGGAFGGIGDSHGAISLNLSRELLWGLVGTYNVAYDFVTPGNDFPFSGTNDNGAWIHTMALSKSIALTDNIGLDLSGGALYTDNVWPRSWGFPFQHARSSGWNNYFIRAALPIALNCRATLTPYIGYNGTPDTWIGDGADVDFFGPATNDNDILHGGVNIRVNF